MLSWPSMPSPIGRGAPQLSGALRKVPGVNLDFFLAFVTMYLCQQPELAFSTGPLGVSGISISRTLERGSFGTQVSPFGGGQIL